MLLIATVILAFGRHVAILAVGRLLQGLSAALVWTSGLALLTDVFGQERYGEAVGYAQTSVSIGTTCAPLCGGIVYAQGGYSAVSAMSIGTVAISTVLALTMIEPKANARWEGPATRKIHTTATEETNGTGRTISSPTTVERDPAFPNERSALIQKEHKEGTFTGRPVYPLLLRSGRVLAAMGGIFTFSFVIISFEGMIPLFVKETFHWGSARAALTFLSWIIPGLLGPLAGKASDRYGPRWIAVGGFLWAVPPLICLRFVMKDSTSQEVLLCTLLTLVGEC